MRVSKFLAGVSIAVCLYGAADAHSLKFVVLQRFGGHNGNQPGASLTTDSAGNIYGSTEGGGAHGVGSVFRIDRRGNEKILFSFGAGAVIFGQPEADVIMDTQGNLFGTALPLIGGGNEGAVYELSPSGEETVLHAFTGGADGGYSFSNLTLDAGGNLYGTASEGGSFDGADCAQFGCGVVFKISASGEYSVLYAFQGTDGEAPSAGAILDGKGNLYGTTALGGSAGDGTVFKLDPKGKETVLYSFSGGADGNMPVSELVMDQSGNLYGTTEYGGENEQDCNGYGCGVVFKVDTGSNETVLHAFLGPVSDGSNPVAGLVMDAQGTLYGTTQYGGPNGSAGTVYALDTSGANHKVVQSFTGVKDGSEPIAALWLDGRGDLLGTTQFGGGVDQGVAFALKP